MAAMLETERLESGVWLPPWLRHQLNARYEWARQFCRGERILDAACANGYGSEILGGVGRVISLDIAASAVADARRQRPDLRLLLGDATGLPFRDGSFGAFVSFETIEHVRDDLAFVREARRVVRPGGVFICSTPNRPLTNPGTTIDEQPFNRFHVREYSMDELRLVLRRAFNDVKIVGQTGYAKRWANLLARLGRRWRMGAVRLHQLRKVISIPAERRQRHEPREMRGSEEPEVLVALCR